MNENLDRYLEALAPMRNDLLMEMEAYAKANGVPIMELSGMEPLLQILKIQKPQNILEIGTAIGYSALRMAHALPNAAIVTIERDEERLGKAHEYIKRAGMGDRISVIEGDALETEELVSQKGPFDCLFIDAAKGQYQRFFEMYEKYLVPGGIIFTDNVLFKGLVAEDLESIESKRTRNLVKKIKGYNEWLISNEDYETVILPVGDGLAISMKKGDSA
ncbi:SAM-dependent methyltransferase [Bacillus sp. FJAT-27916]|uniref:O-methyltransferase n=1 Tax=Bacillus sp. FJAT-27916 TaxID=1679169 RepID=UPI0006707B5B|nr:O-methyltransferase [Bacillus sp. FJAT-27916]KMY43675.1 SAM-dependent methyltransferase [Bacillus sp. FJAT-27916]